MTFVVEIFWVVEHQAVTHISTKVLSVEVVVPSTSTLWDHEETQEFIT